MSALQPELLELETRYNQLVDAVYNKTMSVDDAMRTLGNLQAVDGDGMLWGMDPEGNFVSGVPGTQLEISDPENFRPARMNAPTATGGAPWAGNELMSPPSGGNLHRDGLVTPHPTGQPPYDRPSAVTVDGNTHTFEPPAKTKKVKAPKEPKAPKIKGEGVGGALSKLPVGGLLEKLKDNKRTVAFILIAIIAISAIVFTQGKDEAADPGSGIPAAGTSDMPVDGSGDAAAAGGDAAAATDTISAERVNALLAALVSGKRDLAGGSIENPGDEKAIALNTAKFVGWTQTYGFSLAIGPAAPDGDGAVADITLTDASSGETALSGKAYFVPGDTGTWYFKNWPELG